MFNKQNANVVYVPILIVPLRMTNPYWAKGGVENGGGEKRLVSQSSIALGRMIVQAIRASVALL